MSSTKLFSQRRKLVRIFGKYSETDKSLQSSRNVLTLLKLALFAAKKPVAQVEFPAIIPDNPQDTYVRFKDEKLRKAVSAFLAGRSSVTGTPKLKGTSAEKKAAAKRRRQRRKTGNAGLEDAKQAGEEQAVATAGKVPYPVYFPRFRVPLSTYVDVPRVYKIEGPDKRYVSYRMVLKKGSIGEYYGVQGTTWKDPPILSEPHENQRVGGRQFEVHYDGRRHPPRRVAHRQSRLLGHEHA